MVNNLFIYLCIYLLQIFNASNWYFQNDDPWEENTSSRSSALGGVDLDNFQEFLQINQIKDSVYNWSEVKAYGSSMYDNSINYNNIFYTHNLKSLSLLGNEIEFIRIGLLNRKVGNISNTLGMWTDELNPPTNPGDYLNNNGLIDYYNHNDFSGSVFIPLENNLGQFYLDIKPGFSKIGANRSKSLNIDISYSPKIKFLNNKIFIGAIINNFFSWKKWDTQISEKFHPSLSFLMSYNLKNFTFFSQISNFYLNSNYIIDNYDFGDNISIGIEYFAYERLYLRCGYNNEYSSLGLGIDLYDFYLDYAYVNHRFLGNSSQLSISYSINKK